MKTCGVYNLVVPKSSERVVMEENPAYATIRMWYTCIMYNSSIISHAMSYKNAGPHNQCAMTRPSSPTQSLVCIYSHYYVGQFDINLTGKGLKQNKQNKHTWHGYSQGVMTNRVPIALRVRNSLVSLIPCKVHFVMVTPYQQWPRSQCHKISVITSWVVWGGCGCSNGKWFKFLDHERLL